jgi:hypothetical protein
MNIMRKLRLQLKTGFLQKEPAAYKFMQRYPPLSRDTAPPVRKVETRNVPYLKYYENAVAQNALYSDEKVYPAYWAHEPQALTLAKKQYDLLQKNPELSEDEAYQQAMAHVDELEDKAYSKLKALLVDVEGAKLPYASDAQLSALIASWRQKLAATTYNDLPLADQGEIDWIVQTKVLGWHEVERERRMKDPIFVLQFERLRAVVFPEIGAAHAAARLSEHEDFKAKLYTLYGVNPARLTTARPFFYEEYQRYFSRLREQPMLGRWSDGDREGLSRWIVDCLALREVLERSPSSVIQRYLDALRAQFFPMVRYPARAASFSLPSVQECRQLLYDNDVGYKQVEGKMFVRRAYRLPRLLFPKESLTTALLTDQEKLSAVIRDEGSLLSEISRAGLDEATLPELQQQLRELTQNAAGEGQGGAAGSGMGLGMGLGSDMMTPLDDLLAEDLDVEARARLRSAGGEEAGLEDTEAGGEEEGEGEGEAADVAAEGVMTDLTLRTASALGPEGWEQLKAAYFRKPTTTLEQLRLDLFSQIETAGPEDAEDELDLYHYKRTRTENQLVTRARLSMRYEDKEAARRNKEWRERGVWLESLPRAQLNIVDRRESS